MKRGFPLAAVVLACAVGAILASSEGAAGRESRVAHGFVSIEKTGSGSGRVLSRRPVDKNESEIDCGPVCYGSFVDITDPAYTPTTLTATPDPGSSFVGWSGACSGTGTCTIDPVIRLETYSVGARFSEIPATEYPVAVGKTGDGTVTSTPGGIDCGAACSAVFPTNSNVTLNAAPAPEWVFERWDGACSGSGPCSLTIDGPKSVTAIFAPPSYPLAVARSGQGKVTSAPSGIDCAATCIASFVSGTAVTLVATPDPEATFVGWGGACSGAETTCVVPMTAIRAVVARFSGATSQPVAVVIGGSGSVASSPAGVSCGQTCEATFAPGSKVALTATAAKGWLFAGWGGSCRGAARICALSMTTPMAVTASFQRATLTPLVVTINGKGSVRGVPGKLSCPPRCTDAILAGKAVKLTATPAQGWVLARWSGACAGRAVVCKVVIDGPKSVAASFARAADQVAPRARALTSSGAAGTLVRLRYTVSDASGKSRETVIVLSGAKHVAEVHAGLHAIDPDELYSFVNWRAPAALRGKPLRFCVTAFDVVGNRSRPSCASLKLS